MESYYALAAIVEGVVIFGLVAIVIAQHQTIREYRQHYLSRGSHWARSNAR